MFKAIIFGVVVMWFINDCLFFKPILKTEYFYQKAKFLAIIFVKNKFHFY